MTGRDQLTVRRTSSWKRIYPKDCPWISVKGFFEKFCCFEISIEDSYETFSKGIPKTTNGYHQNYGIQNDKKFSIVEVQALL